MRTWTTYGRRHGDGRMVRGEKRFGVPTDLNQQVLTFIKASKFERVF